MNYWGISFICMWILAFLLMFVILWLDEREAEREQQEHRLAQLMNASGGIRSESESRKGVR